MSEVNGDSKSIDGRLNRHSNRITELQAQRVGDRKDLDKLMGDMAAMAESLAAGTPPKPSSAPQWIGIFIAFCGIAGSLWGFGIGPIKEKNTEQDAALRAFREEHRDEWEFFWSESRLAREQMPVVIDKLEKHIGNDAGDHNIVNRDIAYNNAFIRDHSHEDDDE